MVNVPSCLDITRAVIEPHSNRAPEPRDQATRRTRCSAGRRYWAVELGSLLPKPLASRHELLWARRRRGFFPPGIRGARIKRRGPYSCSQYSRRSLASPWPLAHPAPVNSNPSDLRSASPPRTRDSKASLVLA